jgi:predicted lipoprotein with Yx(FWY)xxD motif
MEREDTRVRGVLPIRGRIIMMRLTLGLSATLLTISGAVALAQPAKEADSSAGKIYVDANGMTLYTFDKDEPNKSNCYDDCAQNWPPLMAEANAQPEGEWTIVERTDGTRMWAYDGKPLYLWAKDTKPGDVTGDGVGGVWHVAKPD